MLLRSMLFIQAAQQQSNPIITFLPIIVMFAALYLLFILPQQRAGKKHKKMLEELKKGNKVITSAGMLGEIKLIKDDIIHIEIAPKVEIKVLKSTVTKIIEDNADLKLNE